MNRAYLALAAPLASMLLLATGCVATARQVQVDLTNVSGQVKTDWPVILRVYTVFGRNLRPGVLQPGSYHVYGPSGNEIDHMVESIPPYDQPGNDEIVFLVPHIEPGRTLTYTISHTPAGSHMHRKIDLPNSPHNLLAGGDFERASADGTPEGFVGPARQDRDVRHSGKASLRLTADGQTVSTRYARSIPLHKGSWYYFGAWSKTDNVARFGYEAGSAAHFRIAYPSPAGTQPAKTAPALLGEITPQCSTRDWLKVTFESGYTDWGVERYVAQATDTQADVQFILEQPHHYYMQEGKTRGTWRLDDVVLMEQPQVHVRFDKALAPHVRNGIFLFERSPVTPLGQLQEFNEKREHMWPCKTMWCAMPFAHEKLETFDRDALKGQRISFGLGLYHTRPIENVVVRLRDNRLKASDGTTIPLETIEYCPGYLGAEPSRYMKLLYAAGKLFEGRNLDKTVEPVVLKDDTGVRYFFLTFAVPRDARAGRYRGEADVLVDGHVHQTIPVVLHVQNMQQPVLKDTYVGLIYNGGLPDVDDMLRQYSRSGFNQIMWFHRWVPHAKGQDGLEHIDAAALGRKMQELMDLGITAGVGLYTDIQLDDKPKGHQGWMIAAAREQAGASKPNDQERSTEPPGVKDAYARMLRELDAAARANPDWPRIIHMNWDEPPPFNERMGWTQEILPDAITTLDVQFARLPRILKYYNTPAMDDPANWAGPEIYGYLKAQGKAFGMCGATDTAEADRYQAGMFMITSGATYFHAWHIRGGHTPGQMDWDKDKKITLRGHEMIAWAGGMDDLKAYHLLKDAIDEAKRTGRNAHAVKAAEDYLAGIFAIFNGDHKDRWSLQPYLGTAWSWGYDAFYDDFQKQMIRHAAAIQGVKWVD